MNRADLERFVRFLASQDVVLWDLGQEVPVDKAAQDQLIGKFLTKQQHRVKKASQ